MSKNQLRRGFLFGLPGAAAVALPLQAQTAAGGSFNVLQFGAQRNGRDLDTKPIQSVIDACAKAGGGVVHLPAGSYHTGGLLLKNKVHLYLEPGATLLGSTRLDDYPKTIPALRSYTDNYTERSLIYGEDLENVGLHGEGVIDGRGTAFQGPYKVRPYLIRMVNCRGVAVSGLTIRDSPMWVQHYLACDDVYLHGLTVHSRVNANNDGIDIDGCQRVTISDCSVSSGDDAIVLKSTLARPTRGVTITNCVLSSHCNAFKLGTESNGGFEDIVLSNCALYETRLAGIAIEMVDGGRLEGVSIANVTMRDVKTPIFIRLGDRGRPFASGGPRPLVGKLRNVRIAGVEAKGAGRIGCAISGIPGHFIENVVIRDVAITCEGGVREAPVEVPEHPEKYPEHDMFGTLPAYGFYCRHVRNLRFDGLETNCASADERPALAFHDVRGLSVASSRLAARQVAIRLLEVEDALIQGCRLSREARYFLEANACAEVSLTGNHLALAAAASTGAGVFEAANRTRT